MKLKQKLIIIILLISGIPLILFSVASNWFFSNQLKQTISQSNLNKSKNIQTKIDDLISSDFKDLKILARNSDVRAFNKAKVVQLLTETKALHPELTVTLDDAKGQPFARDTTETLPNISDRPYFQQAIKGNDEVISNVLISKANKHLIINIATPVRDKDGGSIIGVVHASMELAKISNLTKELSDKTTTVYITDKDGKIIAHPNVKYVTQRKDLSKLSNIKSGLSGKNSSGVVTNYAGQKVFGSYAYQSKTRWLICTDTIYSSAMAKATALTATLSVATVMVLIVIALTAYFLSVRIAKPLVKLSNAANQIAGGNLNVSDISIKSKDEIGNLAKAFSIMTTNLKSIVKKIKDTSNAISAGSKELTNSTSENTKALSDVVLTINEIAEGNSKQSDMITNTNDAIQNIASLINDVNSSTEIGANKSVESLKLVEEGQNSLKQQVERMQESDVTTKEISAAISELDDMAVRIKDFIEVINSIAEQTNLLALNASIEAARAGEQGKGFAVVADEIRVLSENSAKAVNQIGAIIEDINNKTRVATEKAENVTLAMQAQKDALSITQTTFHKIKDSASNIAEQSQNIATMLGKIKDNTEIVVAKAQDMSAVTEESSASMQEISASSEEQLASLETITEFTKTFSDMAQSLMAEVDTFKL
ncbi:methyl-accepting chemotaxis protein [Clostridium oryzae]|uniref:Methyl-accepting chemotaxis protein McpA n=1 Tax=Clostridium oryzae TaxID=1450648 RepID=A0A1V4IW76_9CLOT|nr:methyl-accepting chemotaxis protein [Clostridium oryzae]OPJ64034.1 methyl-accepting chemotaxis protein McpA [Clostridium oryzae]